MNNKRMHRYNYSAIEYLFQKQPKCMGSNCQFINAKRNCPHTEISDIFLQKKISCGNVVSDVYSIYLAILLTRHTHVMQLTLSQISIGIEFESIFSIGIKHLIKLKLSRQYKFGHRFGIRIQI